MRKATLIASVAIAVICVQLLHGQVESESSFWPRKIETEKGTVIVYQPQLESFDKDRLQARAAVSVKTVENPEMVFGAMWFDCHISTDYDERTVILKQVKVTAAKFPEADQGMVDKLSMFLEQEMPAWDLVMSLDGLLASLENAEYQAQVDKGLKNDPPEIIYKTEPASLILIDGEPYLQPTSEKGIEYVANTAFIILKDDGSGKYFLKGGDYWFESGEIMKNWANIPNPPKKIEKVANEAAGESGESAEPPADSLKPPVPEILVRTGAAELIQSDGEPEFAPLEGTSLLYMTNTPDFIIMDISAQVYYTLISGRWYSTRSLMDGKWAYVEADKLPDDFSNIPRESDVAEVRSSVAGTQEAKEAVLQNQIPQTAEIDRTKATLKVDYDGKPKFEPVGETGMKYAVNTDKSVLLIDGRYYCCDNAIWFESNGPEGPWTVSVSVPDKVNEIPPESPVYNVKYVYIYDYTPEVVYVGYTPGYTYSYVYGPTVVYGTGYYYTPWYGAYYYPRPVTYGFRVSYNPYTGWGFSFGVSVGGPYGWMSFGWHSPYYGYWGPAGYRHGYYHGYNRGYSSGYARGYYHGKNSGSYYGPRPTQYAENNIYRNRDNGVKQTGGIQNPNVSQRVPRDAKPSQQPAKRPGQPSQRPAQPSQRPEQPSQRPAAQPSQLPNNVYTDRDGNVYRKDGDNWQQRQGRDWQDLQRPSGGTGQVERPAQMPSNAQKDQRPANPNVSRPAQQPNVENLNRDYNSRQRGDTRTNNYNQTRPQQQYSRPSGGSSMSRPSGARPSAMPRGGRR